MATLCILFSFVHPFRKLAVWQRSHRAAVQTYQLTNSFPAEERYGLALQLRRAAYSVPTNIAEGSKRATKRDFARFLNIAEGSAAEAMYLLELSSELGLIGGDESSPLRSEFEEVARMLFSLRQRVYR